jgi:hypothetical protein
VASWKFWKTEDTQADPAPTAAPVALAPAPTSEAEKFARLLDVVSQPVPKPRAMTPRKQQKCGNCGCFAEGVCIRNPPVLFVVPHNNLDVRWPAVKASQWCGEWRPQDEVA